MGKTLWKSLAVQYLLYASPVMNYSRENINNIQVVENGVYRYLMDMTGYATNAALKGEIGASKVITRVIESRLVFIKGLLERNNKFMYEIMEDIRKGKTHGIQ